MRRVAPLAEAGPARRDGRGPAVAQCRRTYLTVDGYLEGPASVPTVVTHSVRADFLIGAR